jgi:hypothetical protein
LDVHARSVVACGLDRETGELFERRLTPSREEIRDWIGDHPGGVEVGGGNRGAQHVDAVEGGFGGDGGVVAFIGEGALRWVAQLLDGRNPSPADGVQRALGRPPKDFTGFARDIAHAVGRR